MKKETSGKKGKLLWLVLGIVVLLAVVGVVLTFVLGGQEEVTQGGRPELYWNVDRAAHVNKDTGLSVRQPAEDGNYYVRFAHDGEQVEIPVADKKLINFIDSLDLMGLTLDENGFAVDVFQLKDVANVIGEAMYVQKVTGDTILANSSIMMNGRKVTIKLSEDVAVYNVSGSGEFVGEAIEASELNPMDTISVYGTLVPEDSEEESVVTHVFVLKKPVESPVYWRADQFYDSTNKVTTREPDANGAYTIKWYVDGETVDLKCKDKDMVSTVDSSNYHWCHWGLAFDEEGYIIELVDSFLASRTLMQCERYDITETYEDGSYVATSLIKNNGATVQGVVGPDCAIYDISSKAKAEGQVNTRVDSLKLGDRVCIWTDTSGKPVLIYVTNRMVEGPSYWNVTRSYSSATKQTTRKPNEKGLYEIEMLRAGDTKNTIYYAKDIETATAVDVSSDMVVGLKVGEGNIIEAVYDTESLFGNTYFVRGYYILDATASVCTYLSPAGSGYSKNGVLDMNAKVWNLSTIGKYGTEITLQVGDYVYAGKTPTGEVAYAYVTRRLLKNGAKMFYWRTDERKYDSKNKVTTREPDAEGYYSYEFAHEGKLVNLKTNKKEFATALDLQSSAPAFALEVKGDIITAVHDGTYAYGGSRYNGWTIMSINGNEVTAVSSSGSEGTWRLAEGCKVFNVSNSYVDNKGEKATLKVGDNVAAYRDMYTDVHVIMIKSRETNKMAWPVDPQYDSTTKETTRTADADGWYYIDLAVDGKIQTFKTKSKTVMSMADEYTTPFGVQVKNGELQYVSTTTYVEGVKGAGVTSYTVDSVSGKTIKAIYTLGSEKKTGKTETLTLASDAKIYDVSANAMAEGRFGQAVKLQKGDIIRTYVNEDDQQLYVYVTAHGTRDIMSFCDHCQKVVYWTPYVATTNIVAYDSHYYLASDLDLTSQLRVYNDGKDFEAVLDLNGHTISREGGRLALVRYNDTLTIIDSVGGGVMKTKGVKDNGGVILLSTDGFMNMYAGTMTVDKQEEGSTDYPINGGLISGAGGTFNLYGGELKDGIAYGRTSDGAAGGNIRLSNSTFNMYGGKISGGQAFGGTYEKTTTDKATGQTTTETKTATGYGGNVYIIGEKSVVNISGGTIENGKAARGGNISIASGVVTMTGGTVTNGTVTKEMGSTSDGRGGNIFCNGKLYLKGGTVSNGKVIDGYNAGGNIMATGLNAGIFVSDNAVVTGGVAEDGNNVYLMYSNLTVSGGSISDGGVAEGSSIETNGTNSGGGSSVTIAGGTIDGTVTLGGSTTTDANVKYPDYRTALEISGGNVNVVDASKVYDNKVAISGKPVVKQLKLGSDVLLTTKNLSDGASVAVDKLGAITAAYSAKTEPENIVAKKYIVAFNSKCVAAVNDNNEIVIQTRPAAVEQKFCEYCQQDVDFTEWFGVGELAEGHYYLSDNLTMTEDRIQIASDVDVHFDLCGYKITAKETGRTFYVDGNASLVIQDSVGGGEIVGGNVGNARGGCIYATSGDLYLYGGKYSGGTAGSDWNQEGHDIAVYNGEFVVYGDVTIGQARDAGHSVMAFNCPAVDLSKGAIIGGLYMRGVQDTNIATLGADMTVDFIDLRDSVLADVETRNSSEQIQIRTMNGATGNMKEAAFTTTLSNVNDALAYFKTVEGYKIVKNGNKLSVAVDAGSEGPGGTQPDPNANCEHCQQNVTWTPWTHTSGTITEAGHYILESDITVTAKIILRADIVLDLNGHTITSSGTQIFQVDPAGILSVMDTSDAKTGTITGGDAKNTTETSTYRTRGGNILVAGGGTMNLYSGNITNGVAQSRGGNIYVTGSSTLNVYGGTVSGGSADSHANNIYSNGSTVNIYGGTITDTANNGVYSVAGAGYTSGGNDYDAYITIEGGVISGGALGLKADKPGNGNSVTELLISGGSISGETYVSAHSFSVSGKPVIEKLTLSDSTVISSVGTMESGASVKVNKTEGVFTAALSNANAVAPYFDAVEDGYKVNVTSDNKLEIVSETPGSDPGTGPNPPATETCPHCTNPTWEAWDGTTVASGHYYLTGDVEVTAAMVLENGLDMVIDLRGNDITANGASRVFVIYTQSTLSILDTVGGGVISGANNPDGNGGNIYAYEGTFNLYGGTITGGSAKARGGNIYGSTATINLFGGTVTGGQTADNVGANIFIMQGNLNISGDVVVSNSQDGDGEAIYVRGYNTPSTFTMTGGRVDGEVVLRQNIPVAEISGNAKISEVTLKNDVLITKLGAFTSGASVKINATSGVFTTELLNASDVLGYVDAVAPGYNVSVNAEGKLEVVEGTEPSPATRDCAHCDDVVSWTVLNAGAIVNNALATGHYYLDGDVTLAAAVSVASGADVVVDLNGFSITAADACRSFEVAGILSVQDSSTAKTGKIIGSTVSGKHCGNVCVEDGKYYQYGGTLMGGAISNDWYGGNLYVKGASAEAVISGGVITGGRATRGGNVYVRTGATVTITGDAQILNGNAVKYGTVTTSGRAGNIYVIDTASRLIVSGNAIVDGGNAESDGGNIYCMYSNVEIKENAQIKNGVAAGSGANMLVSGTSNPSNLTISGGTFTNGGLCLLGLDNGATIATISGGTFTDAEIYAKSIATLTVSGAPVINSLKLEAGEVVTVGALTDGASIKVNATSGVITDVLTNANDVVGYFDAVDSGYGVTVNAENKLEVGEEIAPPPAQRECEHCDEAVTWTAWDASVLSAENELSAGHYYLTENVTIQNTHISVKENNDVVIDLNGFTMSAPANNRAFYIHGVLTIQDSSAEKTGAIIGSAVSGGYGGTLYVTTGATLNLYSGTIKGGSAPRGGNIYATACVFNMYGGTVTGGVADQSLTTNTSTTNGRGGNIFLNNVTTNITGGVISDGQSINGQSSSYAGNLMVVGHTTIESRKAVTIGGDVVISGGSAKNGPNVALCYATVDMTGGSVTDGQFYMYGSSTYSTLNISAGTIEDLFAYAIDALNVSGTAKINSLKLGANEVVTIGAMAEGGKILVDAEPGTVFTAPITDTAAVLPYVGTVAHDKTVAVSADGKLEVLAACSCGCGATDVVWEDANAFMAVLAGKSTVKINDGAVHHLKLSSDLDIKEIYQAGKQVQVVSGSKVSIDLNGFTWSTENERALYVGANSELTIINSAEKEGFVKSNGSTKSGGVINAEKGILNLRGGTIMMTDSENSQVATGGVIYMNGDATTTFNMYGGKLVGGKATSTSTKNAYGGAIYVYAGTFNMYGGEISGGVAEGTAEKPSYGGNISVRDNETVAVNLYGGLITGGSADNGDDIYDPGNRVTIGADMVVCSSVVDYFNNYLTTDESDAYVLDNMTFKLSADFSIADFFAEATQLHIGNDETPVEVTIDLNGYTWTGNHRLYVHDGSTLNIKDSSAAQTGVLQSIGYGTNNGRILTCYGTVNIYGGTLKMVEDANVAVTGGGLIYISKGELNIYGGVIEGGNAVATEAKDAFGGNIYIYRGTLNIYDGIIRNGVATGSDAKDAFGGNICMRAGTTLNITGGTISGGTCDDFGSNIYLGENVTYTKTGGTIENEATSVYTATAAG